MKCFCELVFLLTVLMIAILLFITLLLILLRKCIQGKKSKLKGSDTDLHVGIFHPYCNAGGGGERVLWCAVRALQQKYKNIKLIIYSGDADATAEEILKKARNTFNIDIDKENVKFIFLKKRKWVEAERYPYFTLLGQSLGSLVMGLEALFKYQPDVFIDTMGYAFILPLFRYLGGCKIGCYVHYPTISTDMLKRVQSRIDSHNNRNYVVKNPFLTWIKIWYYRLFAKLYSVVGSTADTIMVNSSWTENHILTLWNVPFKTHRVYPPCEVNHLKQLESINTDPEIIIMSVGQFRPEKDHPLQLQALYELRTLLGDNENIWNKIKLVIVGSCRNDEDLERMQNMKDLSKHLSLENSVEFKVNVSYDELIECYRKAKIGIHTMWNEHFGISVVECMAAGMIMIANRSGGPLMDIIETSEGSQTGYLAVDALEYAKSILVILANTKEQNNTIRNAAIASVDRFSEKEFEKSFLRAVSTILK